MNTPPQLPRLLLVEDDAISRAYLVEALAALPAEVDAAESIAGAMRLSPHRHALWLIDAHLPDGDGHDCLFALRSIQENTPALAITAEAYGEELDRLGTSGFIEVLQKPITMAALHAAVRRVLGDRMTQRHDDIGLIHSPIWDEQRALSALGGNAHALEALRKLFLDELPMQRREIVQACTRGDDQAARATLHKLKASCGFVGAARLSLAVHALSNTLFDTEKLRQFEFAIDDVLGHG